MQSLIPGYEYDIFISYRQKDNKGDKWVSKFVDSIKTELESTFKEDISVYFDENPHDRLQETHNVDKSLEGKLKCLIFVPILSQTYCDSNSYAWQFEFLTFLRMAENDHFGKDVKLRSGNVASRILPIRIHDLESEDIKLFEKETGSVLRALDFVFKTVTGVNRPLLPEDNKNDNLNKTLYRDQVNKVAGAIKEIVIGIKAEPVIVVKEKPLHGESLEEANKEDEKGVQEKPGKKTKRKLLAGIMILVVLIVFTILAYPKIFKRDTLERLRASGERISVAVMPFQNLTNDTTKNDLQTWIQANIISFLSNFQEDLQVRQTRSLNSLLQSNGFTDYTSMTSTDAGSISKRINASVYLYGSISKEGSAIRIIAQLIDTKTEEVFKSFQVDGTSGKISPAIDSLSKMIKDFLIVSKLKRQQTNDFQNFATTSSPEAMKYFIYGNNAFEKLDYKTAETCYLQALYHDSAFYDAVYWLSMSYWNRGLYIEGRYWCKYLDSKRDKMSYQQKLWTNLLFATYFGTYTDWIKCEKQLLEIDDLQPIVHYALGWCYNNLYQYDKAVPEFEKSIDIYKLWGTKPLWAPSYTMLGYAYHKTGQYKKERQLYIKALIDFPDNPDIIYLQAIMALSEGDSVNGKEFIEKYQSIRRANSLSEAAIASSLSSIYLESGMLDKAEIYNRKALTLEPESPLRMRLLASFLIEKDVNIKEGLELVEKYLKVRPENYLILDIKGRGLYKQGRYKEALKYIAKADSLKPVYDHDLYLHLQEAKKAVAGLK
jgi:tetratricopeptide (TPR) repeat protein